MAIATNMGIFLMLGVTTAVLAGFAAFFIHLARRARLFADVDPAPSAPVEASAR
jgi:maltodextrin utilization protein YvdJ